MVQNLCVHYSPALLSLPPPTSPRSLSPPLEDEVATSQNYHPFPPPSVLAAPEVATTLRSLGFGYRAEYIQRTAQMIVETHGIGSTSIDPSEASEKWLSSLRDISTDEARTELLKFIGVGRKVADCVLLMSLDKVHLLIPFLIVFY